MILKFEVFMEKLQCDRMIHMYLPDDYLTSGQTYPVLYMFDGHNLFLMKMPPSGAPGGWRTKSAMPAQTLLWWDRNAPMKAMPGSMNMALFPFMMPSSAISAAKDRKPWISSSMT